MKIKCLLVIAAIAFLFMPVQAQDEMETRHEIGITYGAVPNSVWLDIYTDLIGTIFGETYDNNRYYGPIGLEYYYHTNPLIGVGAVAVFTTNNENAFENNIKTSHHTKTYFTFMPSVKFNWLRKKHWGMYSKLAAGATYTHFNFEDCDENGKKTGEKTTATDLMFNFQASLIGVEAGNQHVRGFAEFGVGEQGIALVGLRYKF
jgi:hypothetical protein